jgi:hypothetical protein
MATGHAALIHPPRCDFKSQQIINQDDTMAKIYIYTSTLRCPRYRHKAVE